MRKGDTVRSKKWGWLGRVTGNATNVRLVWLDGVLKDREANVPRETVEVIREASRGDGRGAHPQATDVGPERDREPAAAAG